MVTVEEPATALAVAMAIGEGSIVAATDMRWRDSHLPGGTPDDRLRWLDDLVEAYGAGWAAGDQNVRSIYAAEAVVEAFGSQPLALDAALSADDLQYREAALRVLEPGELVGSALFVGPDSAAIGLEATLHDGCQVQSMVLLTLRDQQITREQRLLTADSVRRCYGDDAPVEGWWNSLSVPPPVDEQVSSVVTANDGTEISIVNGTPELERLIEWGLSRYEAVGLTPPSLASVTFAPVPACASSAGRLVETGLDSPDLILCTDAYRACEPDRASCTDFRASDRLGMLHELGHAWLLDNVGESTQSEFLAVNDLASWRNSADAWHRRGVEQAAEVMAWGLLEQPIALLRIGDPPCESVAAGFEVLTGSEAPHECEG